MKGWVGVNASSQNVDQSTLNSIYGMIKLKFPDYDEGFFLAKVTRNNDCNYQWI